MPPKTEDPIGFIHPHKEDGCHFRVRRTKKKQGAVTRWVVDYIYRWPDFLAEMKLHLDKKGNLRDEEKAIVEFFPMDEAAVKAMRPTLYQLYGLGD